MNRVHYRNVLTGLSLGLFLSACAVQPPMPPASPTSGQPRPPVTSSKPAASVPSQSTQPIPDRSAKPVVPPQEVSRVLPSATAQSMLAKADVAMQSGQTETALMWLERAQRVSPSAGEVYLAMAKARASMEQWAEAEQLCLKAQSLAGRDQAFRQRVDDLLGQVRRRHS